MKLDPQAALEARERLGLSQDALAEKAEVASSTILRIEHGQEIRPVTARRVARALEVSVADLYPKALAPSGESQSGQPNEATEASVLDLRTAVRKDLVTEAQRAARLAESERAQSGFVHNENAVVDRLLQRDPAEVRDEALDRIVELERLVQRLETQVDELLHERARERSRS